MLALDKIVHHAAVQRPRPVEGHQGGDIIEAFRAQAIEQVLHARTFKLENPGGIPGGKQIVGCLVGKIQIGQIRWCFPLFGNQLQGIGDDGQVAQPQEVKLHQADILHQFHIELGNDLAPFTLVQRQVIDQGLIADDNTGRMGGGMSGQAFQDAANFDQVTYVGPGFGQFPQARLLFEGLFQRDIQGIGHQLGNGVHFCQGYIQRPSHVPDHEPGFQFTESDDLSDIFAAAIALHHILEHLLAAVDAEVHIDIRHTDPAGIEEALENQTVGQRIEFRDPQCVSDQAAGGRSATGTYRDAVVFGIIDEISDYEKVAGESHLIDHANLIFQTLAVVRLFAGRTLGLDSGPNPFEAFLGFLDEQFLGAQAGRIFKKGEMIGVEIKGDITTLGDCYGIVHGAGEVFEIGDHLLFGFEVKLVRAEAEAVAVFDGFTGLDAQQHIMGPDISLIQVVAVVAGHHWNGQFGAEVAQGDINSILQRQAVVLNLQIKIAFSEKLLKKQGRCFGLICPTGDEMLGNLPLKAGRHGDQPLTMIAQNMLIDTGFIIKPL